MSSKVRTTDVRQGSATCRYRAGLERSGVRGRLQTLNNRSMTSTDSPETDALAATQLPESSIRDRYLACGLRHRATYPWSRPDPTRIGPLHRAPGRRRSVPCVLVPAVRPRGAQPVSIGQASADLEVPFPDGWSGAGASCIHPGIFVRQGNGLCRTSPLIRLGQTRERASAPKPEPSASLG